MVAALRTCDLRPAFAWASGLLLQGASGALSSDPDGAKALMEKGVPDVKGVPAGFCKKVPCRPAAKGPRNLVADFGLRGQGTSKPACRSS